MDRLFSHPVVRTFVLLAGILGGVWTLVESAAFFQIPLSRWFIEPGQGVTLPAGAYRISTALLATTIGVLIFGAAIIVGEAVALFLRRRLNRAHSEALRTSQTAISAAERKIADLSLQLGEQRERWRDDYRRLCDALRRIVKHDPRPNFEFKNIKCVFTVNEDGDTEVEQTYTVYTKDRPAKFWEVNIDVDGFAAPMVTLNDIGFRATSREKEFDLVPMPLDISGARRTVAVFFLPEIAPDSSRTFKVAYKWKGWFGELFSQGQTKWTWSYRSLDPEDIADVTFQFIFPQSAGAIACSSVKGDLGRLKQSVKGPNSVWEYRNREAPVERLDWELEFRREMTSQPPPPPPPPGP